MERLDEVAARLDAFFRVRDCGRDPGFDGFVPEVYEEIGFDWRACFEPEFHELLNGLMLRGADDVGTVFCAAYPSAEVLDVFLRDGATGDLLFTHHPIDLRSGDPRGAWGRGFLPVDPATLRRLVERGLSLYVCHAPLDYHREVGTGVAIVEALDATPEAEFARYGAGFAGIVCRIVPRSTERLVAELLDVFGIPYADVDGARHDRIERVAIVPGGGDDLEMLREAEGLGAQAYVAGEIHSRADNDYIRALHARIAEYARTTPMSLIGVSHAASEHLVMERQMLPWLRAEFDVEARAVREPKWWR
jgi:putative NIF3 family GTP cyclohydrolase 1 type 2